MRVSTPARKARMRWTEFYLTKATKKAIHPLRSQAVENEPVLTNVSLSNSVTLGFLFSVKNRVWQKGTS